MVTPYVGVWIETCLWMLSVRLFMSHPTWVCGLKLLKKRINLLNLLSHPTWVCGLKHYLFSLPDQGQESHPTWVCGLKQCDMTQILLNQGHTLRGCVDWNVIGNGSLISILCHTLRGCVDWNSQAKVCSFLSLGHTLRGCVDWNNDEVNTCIDNQSHPTWVCGLKPLLSFFLRLGKVTPYVGVWIETPWYLLYLFLPGSHTLRGCVDWNINGPVFGNIEDGHTLRGNIWIGALFTRRSSLWKNCKHSASYVFLSRLLMLLWLEKTRTSPNAYLLSVFFCCFT